MNPFNSHNGINEKKPHFKLSVFNVVRLSAHIRVIYDLGVGGRRGHELKIAYFETGSLTSEMSPNFK